jgi:transcriptional regulator with XRE-family HTH domain
MYAHPQHNAGDAAKLLRREAGIWLKQMREVRGLSQRDVANLVGIEYYTFVSQVEAGRGRVPPDRYEAWAKALGLDVSQFVRTLLRFYDPITHALLFPGELPPPVPATTI